MTNILITGASRGLGFEMAKAAVDRGWQVYGSVRTQADAEKLSKQLGDKYHPLIFDVTNHNDIKDCASELLGEIDILINNAGVIGPDDDQQSPLNMDFAGFAKTLEINTLAPLAVSQSFLAHLKRSQNPRTLSISSQMAFMGYAKSDRIAYRASKAALNKVMQGLATDLRDDGITVTMIDPGWVRTDMGGKEADMDAREVGAGIIDVADRLNMNDTGCFLKWNGEKRDF